jgi:hypothetical protein
MRTDEYRPLNTSGVLFWEGKRTEIASFAQRARHLLRLLK